jgi:hypothetical protein
MAILSQINQLRRDVERVAEQIQPPPEGERVRIYVPWDGRNPDQLGGDGPVVIYDPDAKSRPWPGEPPAT